jgi:hypothetical protein
MVWIFGFGIMAVLAVLFFGQLTPVLNDACAGPEAVTINNEFNSFLPSFFSWVFAIVFISLPLIGLGLAFLVPIDSFWYWIYAALSIVILGIGWMFDSLWGWFLQPAMVSDAASQIVVLDFILGNYLLYSIFVLAIIGMGTYYKGSGVSAGGYGRAFR